MKRFVDLVLVSILSVLALAPCALIALLVRATSQGPVIYWSERIGQHNRNFRMPKFRSMRTGTPPVATHLLTNPAEHVTPMGAILRRFSLDELPQLWSVLVGDMSLVGPRPALFNQDDLVEARMAAGVHRLRPGITGWAQINGRDEIPISAKVALDAEYLARQSVLFDLEILFLTVWKVFRREGVSH